MKSKVSFKWFFLVIVIIAILSVVYNFYIFNKTMDFIENHHCVETNQVRYNSDSDGNVDSTIKYTCDNGDFWLNDYHQFKSFIAIFKG